MSIYEMKETLCLDCSNGVKHCHCLGSCEHMPGATIEVDIVEAINIGEMQEKKVRECFSEQQLVRECFEDWAQGWYQKPCSNPEGLKNAVHKFFELVHKTLE